MCACVKERARTQTSSATDESSTLSTAAERVRPSFVTLCVRWLCVCICTFSYKAFRGCLYSVCVLVLPCIWLSPLFYSTRLTQSFANTQSILIHGERTVHTKPEGCHSYVHSRALRERSKCVTHWTKWEWKTGAREKKREWERRKRERMTKETEYKLGN